MSHLVCPTVLLVDDQAGFGRALKAAFLDKGSVGSLFVPSLKVAADVLSSKAYQFDAVITDWLFETGDDTERQLFDGLDLLKFLRELSPSTQGYLITAQGESENFRARMVDEGYDKSDVFIKQEIELAGAGDAGARSRQPWNRVRRDVFLSRIRAQEGKLDAELRGLFPDLADDDAVARAMETMLPPSMTYLEEVGGNYKVKKPIEVMCTPERDADGETTVRASASKLGLLVDGFGDTPSDAISDLRWVILSTADEVLALSDDETSGFAKAVKARFQEHMESTNAPA